MKRLLMALLVCALSSLALAQEAEKKSEAPPIQVSGAFPHITTIAEYDNPSEAGIGALLPWANRLWFVSYVSHIRGKGTGLYWVDENMRMHKHPASVVG